MINNKNCDPQKQKWKMLKVLIWYMLISTMYICKLKINLWSKYMYAFVNVAWLKIKIIKN